MPLIWFGEVCAMVLIIKITNLENILNALHHIYIHTFVLCIYLFGYLFACLLDFS